jgi:hypothetical protein
MASNCRARLTAKVSAKRREASQCNLTAAEAAFVHESMSESLKKSRKK